MSNDLFLQPSALLYGPDAGAAISGGQAGRLAGGHIGFAQVKILRRAPHGRTSETRDFADLSTSGDGALSEALARIEAEREELPGLSTSPTMVMGVVNITPDSFSDGGQFGGTDDAIAHGESLIASGADILDIGGESTRPGSDAVPADEELARVLPVIQVLAGSGMPVSIDTRKSEVMRQAAAAGATVINDVSALMFDDKAISTARDLDLPVILMHSRGDPKTMQQDPRYDDVVLDVYEALDERIKACVVGGIARSKIIVDPGIGFGKTFQHNHALLRGLTAFHGLGVRILLGVSRKGFIGALSGEPVAGKRLGGSLSAALAGVMQGVQMVRVHDVRETVHAVRTWTGIWARDGDPDV